MPLAASTASPAADPASPASGTPASGSAPAQPVSPQPSAPATQTAADAQDARDDAYFAQQDQPAATQTVSEDEADDAGDGQQPQPAATEVAAEPPPLTPEQQQVVKRFKLDPITNRALRMMQPAERVQFIENLDQRARFVDQLLNQTKNPAATPTQQTWPGVPQFPVQSMQGDPQHQPFDPSFAQPYAQPQQPMQPNQPAADPRAPFGAPPAAAAQQQFDPSRFWQPVGQFLGDEATARNMQQAVDATVQANLMQLQPVLSQYQQTMQAQQQQLQAMYQWIETRQFEDGLSSWEPPAGVDKDDPAVRQKVYEAAARLLQTQYHPVNFNLEHAVPLAASSVFNGPIIQAARTQRAAAARTSRQGSPQPITRPAASAVAQTQEERDEAWFREHQPAAT